jgi:hypothetical protein
MVWYALRMLLDSRAAGSLVMKSLVFPEWWLYVPVPIGFALLALECGRRRAVPQRPDRRPLGAHCMIWWQSLVMLFGVLTGRRAGLVQLVRNSVASVSSFSLTPIPLLRADGRGAVPHRPRGQGHRRASSA